MDSTKGITQLLIDWSNGDPAALDNLMPVVYDELRKLANAYLKRERPGHTLQPTALINEAYMRLVDQTASYKNRTHFFSIAARLMRQILVDHARARYAARRGGEHQNLPLEDMVNLAQDKPYDLVALDDALRGLEVMDPQQSRIVELRYFGGLTIEETAEILGISHATVEREWNLARCWLRTQIRKK